MSSNWPSYFSIKFFALCLGVLWYALPSSAQFDYTTEEFLTIDLDDTVFIRTLVLEGYYYSNVNTDTALMLIRRALDMSQRYDYRKHEGFAYEVMGLVYHTAADYPNALRHYLEALSIYEELEIPVVIADIKSRCASVYQDINEFEKALEIRMENILDMQYDLYLGYEYNNIGKIYGKMGQYDTAEYYYIQALGVFDSLINTDERAPVGKAIALMDLASVFNRNDLPDSSITYLEAAVIIFDNKDAKYELAQTYNLLSETYLDKKNDADKALLYARKAGGHRRANKRGSRT